jgi:hypothetical protein
MKPKRPTPLPPWWAVTGRMPNTLAAYKPPVLRTGRCCVSNTGLK